VNANMLFYTAFLKKQAMLLSVRVHIVPFTTRSIIFAAYHANAGNINASFKASFWKLRLRFFWSTMYADVCPACDQGAHCALANAANHSVEYTTLPCD
jgi:hypothetical protein